MFKKPWLWRGIAHIAAFCLAIVITLAVVLEAYRAPVDAFFGTKSQKIVTEKTDDEEDIWNYKAAFKTAKEAYEGYKEFAIRESVETFVLLKNDNKALPLSKTAKVTLLGIRSYAPVYGNSMASIPDAKSTEGHEIFDAFKAEGFQVNPSMLAAYAKYFEGKSWASSRGSRKPEYADITKYNDVVELTPAELEALKSDYNKDNAQYSDAAIVVIGRPGSESQVAYKPGAEGMVAGLETTTGNILGLTTKEMEVINYAKANFDKVIVLINATNPMEIKNLKEDTGIDAIMWIGFPGSYGFHGVAQVLNGTVAPSARLGDILEANTNTNPAMKNYGDIPWANKSSFNSVDNVNGYIIHAEGIYNGYRYYETRYADIVMNRGNAKQAKAGTYADANAKVATVDGTWNYNDQVVYPFGYGLSYTTFEQTLDNVNILGNKKTAYVTVTVKNTGNVAGKSVVQLYAQVPYTQYDIQNGIEKSAIQLIDFEKTRTLQPGETQTITMKVDMANLASYDYKNAKTFVVTPGDYYFAIGDDAHNALNNILTVQGYTTANGMTENISKTEAQKKTYKWTWTGEVDAITFSVSKAGVEITNRLSDGDYSMDINSFLPGTVNYLTRNDWNGTYPQTISGLTANAQLSKLLKNDFIPLKTNDDVSDIIFGDDSIELTLLDLKGAAFDDPRWEELLKKLTIQDFLNQAAKAFHNIEKMESVGYIGHLADDGPGGSDSHYLQEGTYQGEAFPDAQDYDGFGTRVAPAPINLAYAWNKELAFENGQIIMGETALMFQLPIIIGPGMNLHRHAYNVRGAEYYSEDPILSGYIGSAVTQGAQSKGCIVNVKHVAFNDQEINRSGVAVFMTEQKAREMELRNFQQAFEANGKPASFEGKEEYANLYTVGALGMMSSFNRIGAVAPSANKGVMVDIIRNEWGFRGYNVTDFTGVTMKAAPKESLLFGTTAFCGMGSPNLNDSYSHGWSADTFKGDRDMLLAIKQNAHYTLYALANSLAMNGINSTSRIVQLMTWWRAAYISLITIFAVVTLTSLAFYAVCQIKRAKEVK